MLHLIIIIFLLCICASFIQRTTGFGFGVFIMTVLPYLMPSYGEATTLSGLLAKSVTSRSDAGELIGKASHVLTLCTCNYIDGYGRTILVCVPKSEVAS